jgi:hypothetical protein
VDNLGWNSILRRKEILGFRRKIFNSEYFHVVIRTNQSSTILLCPSLINEVKNVSYSST